MSHRPPLSMVTAGDPAPRPLGSPAFTDPGHVMQQLADAAADMAERQNAYERSAFDRAELTRDWDKRLAEMRLMADGRDAEARKAQALLDAINGSNLYSRLSAAEAAFEANKVVMRVLETRATIAMAILKAHGRG